MSHPLHGRWREHWGDGDETELDYTDELVIEGDPVRITAVARPAYRFRDLHIDGDRLSVRLINARDPAVSFEIHYTLALSADGVLTGTAATNHGVRARVRWTRQ